MLVPIESSSRMKINEAKTEEKLYKQKFDNEF